MRGWRSMALATAATLLGSAPAPSAAESMAAASGNYVDIDLSGGEDGLWLTRSDGTVEIRGSAPPLWRRPIVGPGETVVALAGTPTGDGYWLFTNLGNAFAFGAASDLGDVGHLTLNGEIISAVATPDGSGYYMIGTDGGIFSFGTAVFYGSIPQILPGVTLNAPVVAMSATSGGYILVAGDGGTFAFGAAEFYGSIPGILPGVPLASPIVGLVPGLAGYLMLGADGGIFNFGVSFFHGSLAGFSASAAVAVAVRADLSGYMILTSDGTVWSFGDTRSIGVTRVTGTGDTVVELPLTGRNIIHANHGGGSSNFIVWALDSENNNLELVVNEIGEFDGYAWLDDDVARFEIDAEGDWILEVLPLSYAVKWDPRLAPISGSNKDVVVMPPTTAGVFNADTSGGGNHIVWHHRDEFFDDLLLNEIGPVSGYQEPLGPSGALSYLEVDSDGSWTFSVS